jgi:hypothetical protein
MQRRKIDYTRSNDNNNSQQGSGNSRAFNVTRERALYNEFARPLKEQILQQYDREPNDAENLEILQAYQAYRAQAQAKYLQEEKFHNPNACLPIEEIPIVRPSPGSTNLQQRDTSPMFANRDLNRYITFLRDSQREQEQQTSDILAKISPGLLVSIASEINFMFKKRMIGTSLESYNTLKLIRSNIKKIIDYKQGRGVTLQEVIKPLKEVKRTIETLAESLLERNFTRDGAYLSSMNQLIEIWRNGQTLQ